MTQTHRLRSEQRIDVARKYQRRAGLVLLTTTAAGTRSVRVRPRSHAERAMRRTRIMTAAAYRKAVAETTVASGSYQRRWLRLIQAKNLSKTRRRGCTAKPT